MVWINFNIYVNSNFTVHTIEHTVTQNLLPRLWCHCTIATSHGTAEHQQLSPHIARRQRMLCSRRYFTPLISALLNPAKNSRAINILKRILRTHFMVVLMLLTPVIGGISHKRRSDWHGEHGDFIKIIFIVFGECDLPDSWEGSQHFHILFGSSLSPLKGI